MLRGSLFLFFACFFVIPAFSAAAESAQDLEATSIEFIPYRENVSVENTTVHQKGTIRCLIRNRGDNSAKNVKYKIGVDRQSRAEGQINYILPGHEAIFDLHNYSFDSPGRHLMWLTVDPDEKIAEPNEQNNYMVTYIEVKEDQAASNN